MNTLSEIEEYYKAREQQLLKKLHQQEAALAAAEQALKQLTENQKVSEDETARQRAAREQAFEEKLYRDPLTGIYNRRYYEEVARKTIGPAGVALMDVDDFKICNDTYGHYAGDMALKTVANTIQSCIRASDLLIRYGGDEFLLVLSGITGRLFADQTGTDPAPPRRVDLNDRQLRKVETGLSGEKNIVTRDDGFDITVASEIMAILCLTTDIEDLKRRIGNITIGYNKEEKPITVRDLHAEGALTVLLKDAIKPKLGSDFRTYSSNNSWRTFCKYCSWV